MAVYVDKSKPGNEFLSKNQFLHGIGYKATPWAKIVGDDCLLTGQAKLNSELDVGSETKPGVHYCCSS